MKYCNYQISSNHIKYMRTWDCWILLGLVGDTHNIPYQHRLSYRATENCTAAQVAQTVRMMSSCGNWTWHWSGHQVGWHIMCKWCPKKKTIGTCWSKSTKHASQNMWSKLKCRCSQFLPAQGARRSMFSSKPFKRLGLLFGKQAPCSLHLLLQLVHVIIRLIVTNLTFRARLWLIMFFLAILKVLSERNSPSHLTRMLCSQSPPATKITFSWKQLTGY